MIKFKNKISFVIATKDRPQELRRLVESLRAQSYPPQEIIIVDGGQQIVRGVVEEFKSLSIRYLRCLPPSATRQRNLGIEAASPESTLIGLLDDDAVLESEACEAMMTFWENAAQDIGGVSFNLVNFPPLIGRWFKHFPLTEKLGLYSRKKGAVLPSGFQVMFGHLSETVFVKWLSSNGAVWRRSIFSEFCFDEWFEGYSYLEDLDFSYQVGKKYKLVVMANARQYHFPSPRGRLDGYSFGKREVANRLYFVRKHKELSLSKCYLALVLRIFMGLLLALRERRGIHISRMAGNVIGLLQSIR